MLLTWQGERVANLWLAYGLPILIVDAPMSRVFGYPIRWIWIPGVGIGVVKNISGRVLDRHLDDFRV